MLRSLWRRSGKRWLQHSRHWWERQRFADLFAASLTAEQAGALLRSAIEQGLPFCAARMGHVEARILGEVRYRQGRWSRATQLEAHTNAGIFPVTDAGLHAFAGIYSDALREVDLLGFWQASHQVALVAAMEPRPVLCPLAALEPFRQSQPWSEALAGRRVLVVHPFANSIQAQYRAHGSALFVDPRVLPQFRLQVLKPPSTHAPSTEGYTSWVEALEALQHQVLAMPFDLALIGCGAYGLPLAAAIKRAGRQAIHLGGALQLLFGIQGRRWEHEPAIQALSNKLWVRPSDEETPSSSALIEGGCYW